MKAIIGLALLGAVSSQTAWGLTQERELGDFSLTFGTAPARSMAQGLVQPARLGAVHGGFDLTHESGLYVGHWAPSVGLRENTTLEVDSYLGYFHPVGDRLGYELGVIRYSFPELENVDRHEFYSGLSLSGSRLGAALSHAEARTDSTLLLDLGFDVPWRMDMTLKYATHSLDSAVVLGNGDRVRAFDDWSVHLSHPWQGARLGLTYSGSSLGGSGCGAYSGQNPYCQDFWMFQVERPLF